MMPHLTNYIENVWPRDAGEYGECSDLALPCLIYDLGIELTKTSDFWAFNPDRTLEYDDRDELYKEPESNNFHYILPDEMYDLDEFYSFLHIDRLVNDKNWKELTEYTRTFISSHYELLRIKNLNVFYRKFDNTI
jgi:hypothetical protein